MKQPAFKSTLLRLAIASVAFLSSILTACSSTPQNQSAPSQTQAASPAATDADSKQMDHSGMNHDSMGGMDHGMDLGAADADFDLRFIDAMTPHHQGAVVMAKEAQQKSKRPEIKQLAANIIKAQAKEIAAMKQWRQAWYPKASSTAMMHDSKTGKMMPMSSEQMQSMMMKMDLGAADAEFDLRFINAMLPHHEGAVVMAQDALGRSKRPETQKLAQEIIASQTAEITQMKQWRKAWYGK